MANASNKVKYNLKNVHYAKLTIGEDGAPSFASPVHIPGAVSLSMSPEGETTPFYADGVVYYQSVSNNGYTGDLEMALIPDEFRTEILGDTVDATDKVVLENALANPSPFALLFEFDGDRKAIKHVLFNCTATRPNVEGSTTTESKEPSTETMTLAATPLPNGNVKAKTGNETPENVYNDWYKNVWQPGASNSTVSNGK